jgi:hypothetical protein
VAVKKNTVVQAAFEHPKYETHLSKILPGAILPMREVEDFEIYNVDRKFFNGENAIKMVENLLGIDAGLNKVYKYGYQNNHATYNPTNRHNDRGQQSYLGKRPADNTSEYNSYSNQGAHRSRRDDNFQTRESSHASSNYQGRSQHNY